jgi:raffinose/stachyose/melibiose transport system permease protein
MKQVKRKRSAEITAWLMVLPALGLFVVFFLGPALIGVVLSFHDWDGLSSSMNFVGFNNYARLLSTERFWDTLEINWIVVFASIFLQIPLALGLALALTKKTRFSSFYRSAIFVPQVLSVAAVALMWIMLFNPYQGMINGLLTPISKWLGFGEVTIAWLGQNETALASALLATTWYSFGLTMILFMAGLGAIPPEYYDAARIETNSWFDTLRYVTLPLLREIMLIIFVLIFSGSFGHLIGFFLLLTGGGPAGRTELLGIYMYKSGFRAYQFGYASALSVTLVLIVLIFVTPPALRIARERLEY